MRKYDTWPSIPPGESMDTMTRPELAWGSVSGAGASGLVTAKTAREAGHEVTELGHGMGNDSTEKHWEIYHQLRMI